MMRTKMKKATRRDVLECLETEADIAAHQFALLEIRKMQHVKPAVGEKD